MSELPTDNIDDEEEEMEMEMEYNEFTGRYEYPSMYKNIHLINQYIPEQAR